MDALAMSGSLWFECMYKGTKIESLTWVCPSKSDLLLNPLRNLSGSHSAGCSILRELSRNIEADESHNIDDRALVDELQYTEVCLLLSVIYTRGCLLFKFFYSIRTRGFPTQLTYAWGFWPAQTFLAWALGRA